MPFNLENYRVDNKNIADSDADEEAFDLEKYRASPHDIIKNKFPFANINPNQTPLQSIPGANQLVPGAKEGFQGALNAIPGLEKYLPKMGQQLPVPQNEENAQGFREAGRLAGSLPVMGAIGAPIAATGGALGIPGAIADIGAAGLAGGLTTPGDLFHRGVVAAESALPVGAGKVLAKLPEVAKTLFSKINPQALVQQVQKGHDVLSSQAKDIYDLIRDQVKSRGIDKIKIDESALNKAKEYLPKTDKVSRLLEKAKEGSYDALHDLQSELGKSGSLAKSSKFPSERNTGFEMLDTRRKINDAIDENFKDLGHEDLSKLLKEAKGKFQNLMDTYYSHTGIGKMVDPLMRKIPKNPISLFSEDSVPMKKIWESHPDIPKAVQLKKEKEKLSKILKGTGIGTGSTLTSLSLIKYLLGGNSKPNISIDQNEMES